MWVSLVVQALATDLVMAHGIIRIMDLIMRPVQDPIIMAAGLTPIGGKENPPWEGGLVK